MARKRPVQAMLGDAHNKHSLKGATMADLSRRRARRRANRNLRDMRLRGYFDKSA